LKYPLKARLNVLLSGSFVEKAACEPRRATAGYLGEDDIIGIKGDYQRS
jgi:hypothetical protein